ncbi:response regulator [Roseiconus nitratireducens]|uniref:Response regulator n=1 Tax=Roseiconus nitratireducens TaxID=2605748 RepID=A0A5M6D4X7_9BACT|nr:response regulator [Roseiconus nitratireducens]KAA5542567.1 response regulator [Roseiconus nitratireducens]
MCQQVPSPQHSSLKVLVVDDTRLLRWSMTRLLEQLGHRCWTATNGYEGWQVAKSCRPDLVVTDLEMPIWNGFKLIRALRNGSPGDLGRVPVIVCSSRRDNLHLLHAMELGADAFVTKPLRVFELKLAIENSRPSTG